MTHTPPPLSERVPIPPPPTEPVYYGREGEEIEDVIVATLHCDPDDVIKTPLGWVTVGFLRQLWSVRGPLA